MVSDVIGDVKSHILQTFPERQIYLRSGGEVTYYNLSTRLQVFLISTIVIMVVWSVTALLNVAFGFSLFGSPDERIVELETNYQRQLADRQAKIENAELLLTEQRESFESMAATIEAKHNTLVQIVGMESVPTIGAEPAIKFAESEMIMAPTRRDNVERVPLRGQIASHDISTGLAIDHSLASLDETQNDILMSAEEGLLETIEVNRAIIESTDMEIDAVLEEGTQGQGGPYLPVSELDAPMIDGSFQPRIATIQARLYEAEALAKVVDAMPLGEPVDANSMMTSHFGVRRDPFTKRPTFHQGLDFISGSMAPIVATAAGTVVYSGRKGSYGNVVEIDHGHGFVTRYAHMKKTFVKRGQTVEKGQKIGGMGSTGRSTGTHLHYEVYFQGRAYDPKKFLKAGLYVQ